jgi:hypothetical protein
MKRILIIVLTLAIAAGIVLAGILLRGGGSEEAPGGGLLSGSDGSFLPIGTGGGAGTAGSDNGSDAPDSGGGAGLSLVSQASVLDYAANPAEGLLVMDALGAVISFASGAESIVARANFGEIQGAWFSPDGTWLLVRSGSSAATRWSLLDVAERTWRDVPASTDGMVWSPDGARVAYLTNRTSDAALTLLDPETGNIRTVLTLAAPDLMLAWRNAGNITLMERPSARTTGSIWGIATADGALTSVRTGVPGAHVLWDRSGERGLLFRAGPTGGVLELVDRNGNVGRAANFLTLPSKCVFGNSATGSVGATTTAPELEDYVFCAIPRDAGLFRDSQLPDDYIKKEFSTSDILYAVDLVHGAILPVTAGSQTFTFDAANLKIYGNELYFTDRNTRKLYRVPLTEITGITEEEDHIRP